MAAKCRLLTRSQVLDVSLPYRIIKRNAVSSPCRLLLVVRCKSNTEYDYCDSKPVASSRRAGVRHYMLLLLLLHVDDWWTRTLMAAAQTASSSPERAQYPVSMPKWPAGTKFLSIHLTISDGHARFINASLPVCKRLRCPVACEFVRQHALRT